MNEQSKPQVQGLWKEHFELWKVSGLTQRAYCRREGISYRSFVYQHNRVNSIKKTPITFIEAKIKSVASPKSSRGLHVLLPNGLCKEELAKGGYPSALQLCQRVASRIADEHPKLLSSFEPYQNHHRTGQDWTKPTFYEWCNSEYKSFKNKLKSVIA